MSTAKIKQLEALRIKRKELQEKEDKIKADLITDLSTYLIEANALDVDFEVLMGGVLDVIEKAGREDKIMEVWKEAGQKFCQRQKKRESKKNQKSAKTTQDAKDHDQ